MVDFLFSIGLIELFSVSLIQLKRYRLSGNLSKLAFLEGDGSLSTNMSGTRVQGDNSYSKTPVGVERLEISCFVWC